MRFKIRIVIVNLILSLFCSSLCMCIGKCITISNKEKLTSTEYVSDKAVEEPIVLNGTITDYYANGEAVNRGSSTNPLPTEISTNSHPLTKNDSLLIKLEEIAALPNEPDQGWIYDDVGENFSTVNDLFSEHQLYDNLWGDRIYVGSGLEQLHLGFGGFTSDIATGDVDGDGLDEVIVATDDDYLEIYDFANNNCSKRSILFENLPEPVYEDIGYNPLAWKIDFLKTIAVGDVDGDGIDEIAIARSFLGGRIEWHFSPLPILDLSDASITIYFWVFDVVEWDFIGSGVEVITAKFSAESALSMEPEVALGDVDGDGLDEIIIGYCFGGPLTTKVSDIHIFDDFNHGFARIWDDILEFDCQFPKNEFSGILQEIDIVCGDFDGDKKDEIAFAATPYDGTMCEADLLIIDDSVMGIVGQYGEVAEFRIGGPDSIWQQRLPIACGDIDGDGKDEIGVTRSFITEHQTRELHIYEFSQGNYTLRNSFNSSDWDFIDCIFTMGDVDCDGLAELAFSGRYGNYVVDDANAGFTHIMNKSDGNFGLLACGDFDGDGMRLKYTGENWRKTAPPGMLVALAAPPVYAGIVQNYDWSWSAFGKAASTSTASTTEVGTSVSSTISFEQSLGWWIELLSFSWSRTVGRELTLTNTKIKTAVQEISYSSGCWIDSVIYHLTDYQSYKYEITHHPFNTTLIGQFITLDIPYPPSILKTTMDYFDSHYDQTVHLETFNHTIGQPWTYPARNETSSIASECLTSGEPISVGQGTGNNVVTIEIEEFCEYGITDTHFSDYSAGAAVLGFGYSYSEGTSNSKCYEISMSTSCIYEGSVGDIRNEARFEELQYSFGIFIYYVTHSYGFTYQVINYYVEGAIPYFPSSLRLFFVNNWEWLTGVSGGVIGLAIIIPSSVAFNKRRKLKPKTKKQTTKGTTKTTKKTPTKKASTKKPSKGATKSAKKPTKKKSK